MSQHFFLDLAARKIGLCVRTATDHAPRNLQEAAIDQSERRDARDLAGTAAQAGEQIGVLGVNSWQRQGLVALACEMERGDHRDRKEAVEDQELRPRKIQRNMHPSV